MLTQTTLGIGTNTGIFSPVFTPSYTLIPTQKTIPMKTKRNSIYAEMLKPIQSAEVKAFMMLFALGINTNGMIS